MSPSLLRQLATSWPGDALLAAAVAAWALGYQAVAGTPGIHRWTGLIFVLVFATALAIRRRWPVAAAAATGAAVLAVRPLGLDHALGSSLAIFTWTTFLLAYALGTIAGSAAGLAGVALLTAGLQGANPSFNPFLFMITFGPWLAGRIIVSRRRLTDQLEARNSELQAERELFARQAVRYERARIARELHDIVAHCVTVMVVQAGAGQRLADTDHDGATEALDSIAEAAAAAQLEIGKLAGLLGGQAPPGPPARLDMVGELVRQASQAGLAVSCRFAGACDELAPAASGAAYRVVQEALTNALKHAPGAPVDITIRDKGAEIEVDVVNAAPRQGPSGLERSGGGRGLAGMRDRVAACGGSVTAGKTPAGGWRVSALLPNGSATDQQRPQHAQHDPAVPSATGLTRRADTHHRTEPPARRPAP
jgi:signal transduction histidine kinase